MTTSDQYPPSRGKRGDICRLTQTTYVGGIRDEQFKLAEGSLVELDEDIKPSALGHTLVWTTWGGAMHVPTYLLEVVARAS